MKFFNTVKTVLLWLWQIPQNLIGACIILVNLKSWKKGYFIVYTDDKGTVRSGFVHNKETLDLHSDIVNVSLMVSVYTVKHLFNCGISLGRRIIIDSDSRMTESTIRHEHGHQIQSLYLGWLYLVVIGLPSICGNIIDRTMHKKWAVKERIKWYYSQPWEKWADRLGGVDRAF